MAEYNVDIVNLDTGEVLAESLQLGDAHLKIQKNGWVHVETSDEEIPGDGCGGGEGPFTLDTLWVSCPDEESVAQTLARYARAAKWWDY